MWMRWPAHSRASPRLRPFPAAVPPSSASTAAVWSTVTLACTSPWPSPPRRRCCMHDTLVLHILRETAALQAIEPEWRALWDSDPHATPFQSPAWLLPWWRQFGQPELTAITIRRRHRLIGLLPFYIYREPRSGGRQLLLIGSGTSDYLDGLLAPECSPDDVLRALHLLRSSISWDLASLTQLRPGSRLFQALASRANPFLTESCWQMPAAPVSGLPRTIRRNVTQRS